MTPDELSRSSCQPIFFRRIDW